MPFICVRKCFNSPNACDNSALTVQDLTGLKIFLYQLLGLDCEDAGADATDDWVIYWVCCLTVCVIILLAFFKPTEKKYVKKICDRLSPRRWGKLSHWAKKSKSWAQGQVCSLNKWKAMSDIVVASNIPSEIANCINNNNTGQTSSSSLGWSVGPRPSTERQRLSFTTLTSKGLAEFNQLFPNTEGLEKNNAPKLGPLDANLLFFLTPFRMPFVYIHTVCGWTVKAYEKLTQ